MRLACVFALIFAAACGGGASTRGDAGAGDAGGEDARLADVVAAGDAGLSADAAVACSVKGNPGYCLTLTACAARPGYSSTPGLCPGPADIQCCALVPDPRNNPPTPTGWQPMTNGEVTPAMTAWAVAILNDPTTYPMFSTMTMMFGTLNVLARVEWHPPDFQNHVVHRGVTLYKPL